MEANRRGRGWDERLCAHKGEEILGEAHSRCGGINVVAPVFKGAGHDLQEAITARDNQRANLEAQCAVLAAGRQLVSDDTARVTLSAAKLRFVQKKRLVGRDRETVIAYESLISEFLAVSGKAGFFHVSPRRFRPDAGPCCLFFGA